MLFNSFQYVVFFPLVAVAFFALPHRIRWVLLLAASYYFYMSWKPAYIVLILVTTLVAYLAGLGMSATDKRSYRKACLVTSIVVSLGLLLVFKYYNFLGSSLNDLFAVLDLNLSVAKLDAALPVGISFYTFQTLSYTVDAYRNRVPVEKHIGRFSLYVSFFPQLVAGPIERASRLLPQLYKRIRWDDARVVSGLRLAMWGFFKKMVVADNLASYVDKVYGDASLFGGMSYLVATYFFAMQIYCDFSGYTDIARGSARVLGFDLMENFKAPYLARNLTDFWRRWHISLSTWLRDYLYIPLGGNRKGEVRRNYNLLVTMVLGGLWHGANWTFLVWGVLHGLFLGVGKQLSRALGPRLPFLKSDNPAVRAVQVLVTFHLVCLAWVFFRAASFSDAWSMLGGILTWSDGRMSVFRVEARMYLALVLGGILLVVANDLFHTRLKRVLSTSIALRYARDAGLILAVLVFGKMNMSSFIYFQF